jgi:hypothetical protein
MEKPENAKLSILPLAQHSGAFLSAKANSL